MSGGRVCFRGGPVVADTTALQRHAASVQELPVGPPASLVAAGGVLVVLELPVVGLLSRLVGIGLVLVGVLRLAGLATAPAAQRRLRTAAVVAVLVALLQVLGTIAALLLADGAETAATAAAVSAPGWVGWSSLVRMALGVTGTLLLAVGMAHELHHRDHGEAEDAWWHVVIAVVVFHAPIVVAVVIAHVVGRPEGVQGTEAWLLFVAALVPYGLIARAGHHSR